MSDIRLDFEQHMRDCIARLIGDNLAFELDDDGDYTSMWAAGGWIAWKAATERATTIEQERCAVVCDVECALLGGIAAGPMVTDFGKHTHQSMAAGAKNCAAAIRHGVVQYE